MQYQTAFDHYLRYLIKPGDKQRISLLSNGHIKLIVLHSAIASVVIAYEIKSVRRKKRFDLRMKEGRMTFVTQFVNGLIGHYALKLIQSGSPG